jgi:hypothetical protein
MEQTVEAMQKFGQYVRLHNAFNDAEVGIDIRDGASLPSQQIECQERVLLGKF